MEPRATTVMQDEELHCVVCGGATDVALCSLTCRAAARAEASRNRERIECLRAHGFDACLDEVQAVVRRNLQLVRALDDPSLVEG